MLPPTCSRPCPPSCRLWQCRRLAHAAVGSLADFGTSTNADTHTDLEAAVGPPPTLTLSQTCTLTRRPLGRCCRPARWLWYYRRVCESDADSGAAALLHCCRRPRPPSRWLGYLADPCADSGATVGPPADSDTVPSLRHRPVPRPWNTSA